MGEQQKWIELAKKSPAWISGGISLATAVIGFILLLQGNVRLGVTVLGFLFTALLLFALAYVAFARTTPLIEGGRGVYRFETYRPWALVGLGLVVGLVLAVLLFRESRLFIVAAMTGQETAVAGRGEGAELEVEQEEGGVTAGGDVVAGGSETTFSDACFEAYFSEVRDARVGPLENGATAHTVLGRGQSKREMAGLHFTDFGRSVGGMKYLVFPENELFRIVSVVNGECEELVEFAGRSLSSADRITLPLTDREYVLDLVYDGATVVASFGQVSP